MIGWHLSAMMIELRFVMGVYAILQDETFTFCGGLEAKNGSRMRQFS